MNICISILFLLLCGKWFFVLEIAPEVRKHWPWFLDDKLYIFVCKHISSKTFFQQWENDYEIMFTLELNESWVTTKLILKFFFHRKTPMYLGYEIYAFDGREWLCCEWIRSTNMRYLSGTNILVRKSYYAACAAATKIYSHHLDKRRFPPPYNRSIIWQNCCHHHWWDDDCYEIYPKIITQRIHYVFRNIVSSFFPKYSSCWCCNDSKKMVL